MPASLTIRWPLNQCIQGSRYVLPQHPASRFLSTSSPHHLDPPLDQSTSTPPLDPSLIPQSNPSASKKPSKNSLPDPSLVTTRAQESLLAKSGIHPLGSRRLRASRKHTTQIPFSLLPYQCFQEARKIIIADRSLKISQIAEQRRRIAKALETPAEKHGGEYAKKGRVVRMMKYLEKLKVLADINDPVIKKQFEDGMGDMRRPVFRHLAEKRWRAYKRKVEVQRIEQMHVVPDILPKLDLTAEVDLLFGRRFVEPGSFVESQTSEAPPRLRVQVFDQGERFISILVVDPDVPDLESDSFTSRLHYLAINIPLSPTNPKLELSSLSTSEQTISPWLPPHAQKGAPYHRLTLLVLEHEDNEKLDVETMKKISSTREGFNVRSFLTKSKSHPIGAFMFRTIWDEGMKGVMERHGLEGANVEFRRKAPEKLPYKKKDAARYRGWKDRR